MTDQDHRDRLLIVGNPEPIHVGAHLFSAAQAEGFAVELCDVRQAYQAPLPVAKFNWWLRRRRPSRLNAFSREVVHACERFRPRWLLTTGISPVSAPALQEIEKLGIERLNFLTDDPWSPSHRAEWFMKALSHYDHVFSPRRANLSDLQRLGCPQVSYLPFAYSPEIHFPEPPETEEERTRFSADVVFAGGADADRVPYLAALIDSGFDVALYGGYWDRYKETRAHARGHADSGTLRKAIGGAKVSLCLVRRANRDGHSMRSFEVPAIGACMLVEDSREHRDIFGADGEAVAYFNNTDEMITRTRELLSNEGKRRQMADKAHGLIVDGNNRYQDRLLTMVLSQSVDVGQVKSSTHVSPEEKVFKLGVSAS